jgi:hypothetical protein
MLGVVNYDLGVVKFDSGVVNFKKGVVKKKQKSMYNNKINLKGSCWSCKFQK